MRRTLLAGLALIIVVVAVANVSTGCATIFHPERVNQPHSVRGDVDWPFLILDILFGIIPLIVDLATGAIYRPRGH